MKRCWRESQRHAPVRLPSGAVLLRDDFKSPEETIDAALDVLAEIPARRRLIVLGDVDEPRGSAHALYRRLGERAGHVVTRAIFVTGHRTARAYRAGAVRAGLPRDAVVHAGHSVHRALEVLAADLGPGDVVLLKGRGAQRFERVALGMAGHRVGCALTECHERALSCMLERG